MKIAVLGGGITGLVCAEVLSRSGNNQITIYESEANCGGLASGFAQSDWNWSLERAYHHIFASDKDILDYSREIGFDKFFFEAPTTSSLYLKDNHPVTIPIDTPLDLLLFPLLNVLERIRSGVVIAFLKFSPYLGIFEETTTQGLMKMFMGDKPYEVLFGQPMHKKFGKYAGNILSAFIWARVTKRTKKLGYVSGGFQIFIDSIENSCQSRGVVIKKGTPIKSVIQDGSKLLIQDTSDKSEPFDYVVSTLPSPVAAHALTNVLSKKETDNLKNLKHLASMNLIIETKEKYFNKEYWVSNCIPEVPSLVFVQHTNFVSSEHYSGKHILYIGNYLSESDDLWSKSKEDLIKLYSKHLESITGKSLEITKSFLFKARFSQPIFDKEFVSLVPKIETSNKRVLFANLDMTYPYDRGTNYAVKLGKQAAERLLAKIVTRVS